MATNNSVLDTDDCVKFLIDNEPTAVPRYYCLPMELVKRIATHFLETGQRRADVRWEEI
jgi:Immunity protein Imm1